MTARVQCSRCGRRGGSPAGGATINSLGCTGACLQWAVQLIENPPCFRYEATWAEWTLNVDDVARLRIVCSDINELGCGYLHWSFREHVAEIMCKYDWIERARGRYSFLQKHAHPAEVEVRCPAEVKELCDILESLHRQCLQLPTVVYTLHWEPAEDDACHVRTTTMSGVAVRHASVPRDEPVNVWKHLPPPLYRVAADGNLYTLQDTLLTTEKRGPKNSGHARLRVMTIS